MLHLGNVGAQRFQLGIDFRVLGIIASASFIRVSGVLRSWLTPASISVRWPTWRSMRSRMVMKAWAARRTSVAP